MRKYSRVPAILVTYNLNLEIYETSAVDNGTRDLKTFFHTGCPKKSTRFN